MHIHTFECASMCELVCLKRVHLPCSLCAPYLIIYTTHFLFISFHSISLSLLLSFHRNKLHFFSTKKKAEKNVFMYIIEQLKDKTKTLQMKFIFEKKSFFFLRNVYRLESKQDVMILYKHRKIFEHSFHGSFLRLFVGLFVCVRA